MAVWKIKSRYSEELVEAVGPATALDKYEKRMRKENPGIEPADIRPTEITLVSDRLIR
jgi:hypothetical protein